MENNLDIMTRLDYLVSGIDTVWVLLAAILIFMMQMGFASVEAGFTRSKNTANILMKNLLDFCFGSLLFWLFGCFFGKRVINRAEGALLTLGYIVYIVYLCC